MEKMQRANRNIFLDLFRYVLVFFVISIHYNGSTFFTPIYRLAVPMFFMISGFFNYAKDSEKQLQKSYGFIKGSLKYLVIGFAIYIVYDLIECMIADGKILKVISRIFYKNYIVDFLFFNSPNDSGYHLWFLIALFVCSLIHYIFVKLDKCKFYYVLAPLFLIASLCIGGYFHSIFNYSLPLSFTRNAVFMGMPIFSIGYLLGKLKYKKFNYKHSLIFAFLGAGLLFLSVLESQIMSLEFYICSILSSVFLILFFNSLPTVNVKISNFYYKWIGKNSAFYIYILHILIYNVLVYKINETRFVKCIFDFLICFVVYLLFHLLTILFRHIKLKTKNKKQSLKTTDKT